jgi:hypothetical protein
VTKIVATITDSMTLKNAMPTKMYLATRMGRLRLSHLALALAILAAFAPDAAHVFGDGFGEFFGHFNSRTQGRSLVAS